MPKIFSLEFLKDDPSDTGDRIYTRWFTEPSSDIIDV